METLRILAATPETGRAMLVALSNFRAELVESSEGCEVIVSFGRDDTQIIGVLNALERYVTGRAHGPPRIELNGKVYVRHPAEHEHLSPSRETDKPEGQMEGFLLADDSVR